MTYLSLMIFSLYDLFMSMDSSVTEWLRLTIAWKSAALDFLPGGLNSTFGEVPLPEFTVLLFIVEQVFQVLHKKRKDNFKKDPHF